MSDLFKKIKGIFIEEDASKETPKTNSDSLKSDTMAPSTANQPVNNVSSSSFRASMPIDMNSSDKPDDKFFDILFR